MKKRILPVGAWVLTFFVVLVGLAYVSGGFGGMINGVIAGIIASAVYWVVGQINPWDE